jgi:hypothetical protein
MPGLDKAWILSLVGASPFLKKEIERDFLPNFYVPPMDSLITQA